MMMHSNTDSLE